ncbi:MAG TPA: hypothetical protein VFB77_02755 [Acidimicrobiales bacterium]|nr:hypothetical protein [Acidimicrobiales bacterium]
MTDLDIDPHVDAGCRAADDKLRGLEAYLRASGEAEAPPMRGDLLAQIVLSEIRRDRPADG